MREDTPSTPFTHWLNLAYLGEGDIPQLHFNHVFNILNTMRGIVHMIHLIFTFNYKMFGCVWRYIGYTISIYSSSVIHYIDVIMTTMASQITSLTVVYSTVYSDADQRKHQSSASLAFVWGIQRDRWIPRTKGRWRGKCFHLMTSSWAFYTCAPFNR